MSFENVEIVKTFFISIKTFSQQKIHTKKQQIRRPVDPSIVKSAFTGNSDDPFVDCVYDDSETVGMNEYSFGEILRFVSKFLKYFFKCLLIFEILCKFRKLKKIIIKNRRERERLMKRLQDKKNTNSKRKLAAHRSCPN